MLYQGVKGVTDLMVRPGLINLDFADVRAVMDEMGKAMMGTGEGEGEERAIQAAEKAIANPLLDEISLKGAKGVLINITGGYDLTLFELDEAANRIREEVDPTANIIVGSTLDTAMEGVMRVSVVATGIDAVDVDSHMPVPRRSLAEPLTTSVAAESVAVEIEDDLELPEQVAAAQEASEPSFFDNVQTTAQEQGEDILDTGTDDLPPPAYRPEMTEFQAQPESIEAEEVEVSRFVAPRPPVAGTPTPEAIARLHAAIDKSPAAAASEEKPTAEKPRFGINSLINRMTGHGDEPAAPRVQNPPVQSHATDDDIDPEQERIEIPAFLRRQAN